MIRVYNTCKFSDNFYVALHLCSSAHAPTFPLKDMKPPNSVVLRLPMYQLFREKIKEITDTMLPPSNSCPLWLPTRCWETLLKTKTYCCCARPSGKFGYYGVVSPITNESSACKACPWCHAYCQANKHRMPRLAPVENMEMS